jgi:TonB family protein
MKKLVSLLFWLCLVAVTSAQKPGTHYKLIDRLTTKPAFPSGDAELYRFLQKNIQYPQMERDNNIQGKVLLRFMVDTTGAIQDIKVVRAVSPGLDKEAIRVVKLMPKWRPATYKNKSVAVYYMVPVAFRIQ